MATKISDLMSLAPWTPLKKIATSPKEIDTAVFEVSDDVFVIAQPYNCEFVLGLPDAPFVTMIYWAVSVEAMRYCFSRNEKTFDFEAKEPPPDLLLKTNGSYADLIKVVGSLGERAVYDGVTGSFFHKVISIDKYRFFFLGEKVDSQQKPYAIELRL